MIILCCVHSVHLIESDFPPLLKVWVFWEGQKIWKNLCRIFDKNVVFCACNSVLVKKSTTMFFFKIWTSRVIQTLLQSFQSCSIIMIISTLLAYYGQFHPACLLDFKKRSHLIVYHGQLVYQFLKNCTCLFRSVLVLGISC